MKISALLLSCVFALVQAQNFFLKVPGILGSSIVKGHENEIEVNDFSFSVETAAKPNNRKGNKPNFSNFQISKRADTASPALFMHATTGKPISNVTISVALAGRTEPFETFVLTDVVISSYSQSASQSANEASLSETISIAFAKILFSEQCFDVDTETKCK